EVWDKAVTFLYRAGRQALSRSANREAVGLFEQAIGSLGHLPRSQTTLEQAVDLRMDLRVALLALGQFDKMRAYVVEAEALARDPRRPDWLRLVVRFLRQLFRNPRPAAGRTAGLLGRGVGAAPGGR